MIPFWTVLIIIGAWCADRFYRDREAGKTQEKHHQERMELLRMIKAESLSDYDAGEQTAPRSKQKNFMEEQLKKAYKQRDPGDD